MVRIIKSKCDGCGNCVNVCPFGVLEIRDGKAIVKDSKKCRRCDACMHACPNKAIKINMRGE